MIGRQLFRIEPSGPAALYKTYGLTAPVKTHRRPASCAEIECANHLRGFSITADVSTELGRAQAKYLRMKSGRAFTVTELGDLITFTFAAGQTCFEPHTVSLEREPTFYIKGGDYRGNPLGLPARKLSAISWRDDFGEHQERIVDAQQRG
jgi:hypothetical protein